MKKQFTQFSVLLFVVVFQFQTGSTQTIIWGGEGDANGEFNGGLNDWTSASISPDTINAQWIWEADSKADRGAYSGISSIILSPSASNGAAVFDSDFYDNDGIAGNFGNGIAATPQKGELISPTFSCNGYNDVWVKFHQSFRYWKSNTSLLVSNDGGDTWSPPYTFNEGLSRNESTKTNSVQYINISEYAADKENVKIKFVIDANYYFWIIDDVSVINNPRPDPRIVKNWYSAVNYLTPSSLSKNKKFDFIMQVANFGGNKYMTNVTVQAKMENVSTGNVLYIGSQNFDMPLDTNTNKIIPDTIELVSYIASEKMDTGLYKITYSLEYFDSGSEDGKQVIHYFRIGEDFQKEEDSGYSSSYSKWSYNDGGRVVGAGYQGPGDADAYAYYVNKYKTGDWVESNAVSIRVTKLDQKIGKIGYTEPFDFEFDLEMFLLADTIQDNLLNFANSENDGIIFDNNPNPNLTHIGGATESLNNIVNFEYKSLPVTDADGENEFIDLLPNRLYLISSFFDINTDGNYYLMGSDKFEAMDEEFNSEKRYTFIGEQANSLLLRSEGWYYGTSSGSWLIGSTIKLKIVNYTENLLPNNTVVFANNPVKDKLIVNIDFENTVEKATMAIHTINGSIIEMRSINNLDQGTQIFNTNNLPVGAYLFTIFTKDKVLSKKFIVTD